MTSRQTGRKINQIYGRRARTQMGRRKKAPPLTAREKRHMAQFLICGSVFVLLVAVKFLMPGRMQWLSQHMSGALERNMDVTEVFSAVGRMFSGEKEEGWDDLYRSVFLPQEDQSVSAGAMVELPAAALSSSWRALLSSGNGWLTAPPMALPTQMAPPVEPAPANTAEAPPPEGEAPSAQAQNLAYLLYAGRSLPERVSLEQRVLGFDYCTPVQGSISSPFGYREHPIEGEERFHYGLDLAAGEGAEVACFADGTVIAAGESSSYGKYVIVSHPGDVTTLYAHCSKLTVTSGSSVKKGERIALVGHTGNATGPHLHFELQVGNTYLDPIYYVSAA